MPDFIEVIATGCWTLTIVMHKTRQTITYHVLIGTNGIGNICKHFDNWLRFWMQIYKGPGAQEPTTLSCLAISQPLRKTSIKCHVHRHFWWLIRKAFPSTRSDACKMPMTIYGFSLSRRQGGDCCETPDWVKNEWWSLPGSIWKI